MDGPTETRGHSSQTRSTTSGPVPPFVLRTKLLPPRPLATLLPRPRLYERLERNLEHAVTLVVANAGAGKTTLVAEFLRNHGSPFLWYLLDANDADPGTFFAYLATGIDQLVPGCGQTTLAYVAESAGELVQHPERAADVLLNELLDHVDHRIVVVLDDYHHLGTSSPVHRAMDRLVAYMPDVLHLVVVSRETPPLALARLRTRATVDVIERDDLLFTDEETGELFRSVFGLELTPRELDTYRSRTQGWITALQLVRQVVQRNGEAKGDDADLMQVLRRSERDIFDYFAEEVFDGESGEIRELLMRASLLDRLERDLCAELFPDADAIAMFDELVRRNVFVTMVGEGEEYRLHPLFQTFLRRRYRTELGEERFADEHRRAAHVFAGRQQWEPAVAHYSTAGDHSRAAAIIAETGHEWIAAGKLAALAAFADEIPANALAAHPRALLVQAEVTRLRGDYDEARTVYRRAAALLDGSGDGDGEAECLHALATIARRRGEFAEAFTLLDEALSRADPKSLVTAKCANTRGLCLLQTGKLAEGERELRTALDIAEARGDGHYVRVIAHNLGGPAMVRGDFDEAARWFRKMVRGDGPRPPVPQEATGRLNIARCLVFRGELESSEEELGLAIERCQQFSLEGLMGDIYECFGNLYRARGENVRSSEFYARARRAYADAGIGLARREVLDEEAILLLETGDLVAARATIERLLSDRRSLGDEVGVFTASVTLGRILIEQDSHHEAAAVLEPAGAYFRAQGFFYYEAQTCLELAACAMSWGDRKTLFERLDRALDLAARFDYDYWLRREVDRKRALFGDADVLERLPNDLAELARAAPSATAPVRLEIAQPEPPPDLTIRLLGPVEIVRDASRPIPPEAWPTRRARDILCLLATQPNRRVSKDTLVDVFWGEGDFDAVEKNFHPTISHLRKALNRDQLVKLNFVVYRDGDYLLNPDFSYDIDLEAFDRHYAEVEQARRAGNDARKTAAAEEALLLYRGEFLPGNYDEWADRTRSSYAEKRLTLLETLASAAVDSRDWARALDHAHLILREDAFREEIHLLAMRAHAGMGNRGAVRQQYESLKELLDRELGVAPDPATQRAYVKLVGPL